MHRLNIGDICLKLDEKSNKMIEVEVIEFIENIEMEYTYNLYEVSKNNNYFANGILVHNKFVNPKNETNLDIFPKE